VAESANLLTIPQVVALKGVSERTVRRDIAAGRLRAIHLNARAVRVRKTDCRGYRPGPPMSDRVSIDEYARNTNISVRTVHSWINRGILPAIGVGGRVYFSRAALRRRGLWFEAAPLDPETVASLEHDALIWRVIVPILGRAALKADVWLKPGQLYLRVSDVAKIGRRAVRQVYHDIAKGAIAVFLPKPNMRRVRLDVAAVYLDLVPADWATRQRSAKR
jgi:excisionase family DNA binding protein